jgi:hypothetical protein
MPGGLTSLTRRTHAVRSTGSTSAPPEQSDPATAQWQHMITGIRVMMVHVLRVGQRLHTPSQAGIRNATATRAVTPLHTCDCGSDRDVTARVIQLTGNLKGGSRCKGAGS